MSPVSWTATTTPRPVTFSSFHAASAWIARRFQGTSIPRVENGSSLSSFQAASTRRTAATWGDVGPTRLGRPLHLPQRSALEVHERDGIAGGQAPASLSGGLAGEAVDDPEP